MSVKFATPSAEFDYEVEVALAFHDDDAKRLSPHCSATLSICGSSSPSLKAQ